MSTAHQDSPEGSLPEGSPPAMAIRPSPLEQAKTVSKRAREVSTELRKEFEALSEEVEPELAPDEEKPEPNLQASLRLANLGIKLASKEKEAIQLEREVVKQEQLAGFLQPREAEKRLRDLNRRHLSAGNDLWEHQKKKIRCDDTDTGAVRLLDPRSNALSECLVALYKKADGQSKKEKRPSNWRRDALAYYDGSSESHTPKTDGVWCHITGVFHPSQAITAAHIVPHFLDGDSIGEILFGNRAESLKRAGNALLLMETLKEWFDKYLIVIVPFETGKTPITPIRRWRVDVISSDIRNSVYFNGQTGKELDGKELKFLNNNRPVARFLYFHFIMALIRTKNINRPNWQDVWARYYETRPFPTPGPYMRKSMLLALASHYSTTDLDVVNSWLKDNGFETSLQLTPDETTEAARRVLEAVEDGSPSSETEDEDVSESDSSDEEDLD